MKHLLPAALIATALASPVSGEITQIICEWPNDDFEPISFQIDTERQTIFQVGSSDDWEVTSLIWNDEFIGWVDTLNDSSTSIYIIKSFLLNRQSLALQARIVWDDMWDTNPLDTTLRCTRPL